MIGGRAQSGANVQKRLRGGVDDIVQALAQGVFPPEFEDDMPEEVVEADDLLDGNEDAPAQEGGVAPPGPLEGPGPREE